MRLAHIYIIDLGMAAE